MDTRQKHITFSVAYKAAVDLAVAGKGNPFETKDYGAELAELAKMLYLPLAAELEALEHSTVGSVSPAVAPAAVPGTPPAAPAAAQLDTTPFVPSAPAAPAPAAPAAPQTGQLYDERYWKLTGNSCPTCVNVGRVGLVIQSDSDKWRGPEFMCSLNKSEKGADGVYVQVGFCDWQDWGKNTTR